MNRFVRSFCVVLLAMAARAGAQDAAGQYEAALKRIAGAREKAKTIPMTASFVIASKPFEAYEAKLSFPKETDPGTVVIGADKPTGAKICATPGSIEQMSLLDQTVRGQWSEQGISSVRLSVLESQVVKLSLGSERDFWDFHPKDKRPPIWGKEMSFTVRPVLADSGEVLVRFADEPKSDAVFPPIMLSEGMPGEEPLLGLMPEQTYALSPAVAKLPADGCLLVWGLEVCRNKAVKTSVPVLDMIPLVGDMVTRHSSVKMPVDLFVILKFGERAAAAK